MIDASALLAYLAQEPGWEKVEPHAVESVTSAVNLSETAEVLIRRGLHARDVESLLQQLQTTTIPFDEQIAFRTAMLAPLTKKAGLSLGDRACIATAEVLKLPVLTADSAWKRLRLPVTVQLIR